MPTFLIGKVDIMPTKYDAATKAKGVSSGSRAPGRLRLGPRSGVPLVLLNRFRGTIDWWDPQLLAHLTRHRDNPQIRAFVLSLSI